MPRPFTIRQHYTAANEARCRYRQQNNLQLYSTSLANTASLNARHGALSLKKQNPRPGTLLRVALADAFPAISRE